MEPFNNPQDSSSSKGMHALIPGIVLVGIGALFLLDNLHIVHADNWFQFWPVVLIAVGLVQLVDAGYTGGRIIGAVLMGAGGIMLADNLGYVSFNVGDLWPLILIAVGLSMLWNRTHGGDRQNWWGGPFRMFSTGRFRGATDYDGNVVHECAIFGASKRTVTSPDFQGGTVSSIFGGITLDLRGATMTGNSAVMHVSAIYGGISVRIPQNWTAEVRGAGIFGGFADNTIHPPASADMKRLIVKGGAVFGGVAIKN